MSPSFDIKRFMNDPKFVDFEYTFENVYFPAYVYLENVVENFLESYNLIEIGKSSDLIISLMIIFIVSSFFVVMLSFMNIMK